MSNKDKMTENDKWEPKSDAVKIEVDIPTDAKIAVKEFIDSMSDENPQLDGMDREMVYEGLVKTFMRLSAEYVDLLHDSQLIKDIDEFDYPWDKNNNNGNHKKKLN